MEIEFSHLTEESLELRRPSKPPVWQFMGSGFWYEDMYHSGYVSYSMAEISPGTWIVECLERNALLDDVTQEDVDEGRLNDDQLQAIWGTTLGEAQASEYRKIVACCTGVPAVMPTKVLASTLYRHIIAQGFNPIGQPDDDSGLLEF